MLVVVTREAGRNDELREWLPNGATVAEVPLTETIYRALDEVERDLVAASATGRFPVLALTSARSRDYVAAARRVCTDDVEVWTVGPTTRAAVEAAGSRVVAEAPSAGELGARISRGPVLVLGARVMREELTAALAARAIAVSTVTCYETVARTLDGSARATLARADAVVVGAPSAWRVARDAVSPSTWVVVPGPTTAAVVRAEHDRVLVGWRADVGRRLGELVADERAARGRE